MRLPILASLFACLAIAGCQSARLQTSVDAAAETETWTPSLAPDIRASDRIVNGQRAFVSQWPSFAVLRWQNGKLAHDYACGGAFISPEWVLTAAHCFEGDLTRVDDTWRYTPGQQLSVIGGVDDLAQTTGGNVHKVREVMVHPDYRPETSNLGPFNDIALVRVHEAWSGPLMRLSAGGSSDNDQLGGRTFVAGFGLKADPRRDGQLETFTSPGEGISASAGSQVLLHAMVPAKPAEQCLMRYAGIDFEPTTQICAGHFEGKRDSCGGDSGGPLVALDREGRSYQVGVVSFGFICAAAKREAVYTRVSAFRDFILEHVSDAKFVDAQPETAVVASFEMLSALISTVPQSTGDELQLSVSRTADSKGDALQLTITTQKRGRLIVLGQDAQGRVFRYYPNGRTPEADYVLEAGRVIRIPGLGQRLPAGPLGGQVHAVLLPEFVAFAGDLLPTPEIVRTVPETEQAEFDPVTYASRMLKAIADQASDAGLEDWYATSAAYPPLGVAP